MVRLARLVVGPTPSKATLQAFLSHVFVDELVEVAVLAGLSLIGETLGGAPRSVSMLPAKASRCNANRH